MAERHAGLDLLTKPLFEASKKQAHSINGRRHANP